MVVTKQKECRRNRAKETPNLEHLAIQISEFSLANPYLSREELLADIVKHYKSEALSQVYSLVRSSIVALATKPIVKPMSKLWVICRFFLDCHTVRLFL